MTRPDDTLALYVIFAIILYLLVRNWLPMTFSKWVKSSSKKQNKVISGKTADYLRTHGYEVLEKNVKIPLAISMENEQLDEEKEYDSRLYIDYIAAKDGHNYLVFVEREKRTLKLTGPHLRDRFLSPYLICRPQGILFITKDKQLLHFDLEVPDQTMVMKTTQYWIYLIFFVLGLTLSWILQ